MTSRPLVLLLLLVTCAYIGAQCQGSAPKKFYWFNSVTGVTQWEEPPQWEYYGGRHLKAYEDLSSNVGILVNLNLDEPLNAFIPL
jgi:hypothetical protein